MVSELLIAAVVVIDCQILLICVLIFVVLLILTVFSPIFYQCNDAYIQKKVLSPPYNNVTKPNQKKISFH